MSRSEACKTFKIRYYQIEGGREDTLEESVRRLCTCAMGLGFRVACAAGVVAHRASYGGVHSSSDVMGKSEETGTTLRIASQRLAGLSCASPPRTPRYGDRS